MRSLSEIHITPRELEVLRLLAEGLSNREIAARLGISKGAVRHRLHAIFTQMGFDGTKGSRVLLATEYARAAREMPLLAS